MKRREFVGWIGVGWVASCLPVAIAACSPTEEASSGTSSATTTATTASTAARSDGFEVVGTVTDLDTNGQILNKEFGEGGVLVIRDPDDETVIHAVNPACTHEGCTVNWELADKKYVCPCHAAEYTADGTVVKGPARENLGTYVINVEGDSVLVKSM